MLIRYFGLLFVGMTAAAHASEENGDRMPAQEAGQTTSRSADVCIDFLSAGNPGKSIVALDSTTAVGTEDTEHGSSKKDRISGLHASGPLTILQQSKESAHPAGLRWNKNSDGYRLLRLARHKRIEFNSERYKVTLHHESALIEAGSIKVGLGSGSTSLTWSKAL